MNILYIGSLQINSNSYARFQTLKQMGHNVHGIDTDPFLFERNWLWSKTHHFLNVGPGILQLGEKTIQATISFQPDLIWVDNKPFLTEKYLEKIKKFNCKLINVVTDDAFGNYKDSWSILKRTMKYYDIHFVQRTSNIQEYYHHGAKLVLECDRSFNPQIHFHEILSEEDMKKYGTEILFIGTYAPYRAQIISRLIAENYPVKVRGNSWQGKPEWKDIQSHFLGEAVYTDNYRKYLSAAKIVLHFLRKENRDDQDSRTFEIPACGAFMLAERTEKHKRYFKEGIEADFFDDFNELKDKLNYYLANPQKVREIAEMGRQRVINDGHTHKDRLRFILEKVESV